MINIYVCICVHIYVYMHGYILLDSSKMNKAKQHKRRVVVVGMHFK